MMTPKSIQKGNFLGALNKNSLTFEGMDLYLISRPISRKLPVEQILALHAPTEVLGVKEDVSSTLINVCTSFEPIVPGHGFLGNEILIMGLN